MNNPKISIITITFNSEKTLEETIKSVITQDYDNLEYLIIDGGSKDRTMEIVDKYRDKISFVISEPDKGISDAFNKGIHYATGDIIGIINSDDIMLPETLKSIKDNYDDNVSVYSENVIIWDDKSDVKVREIPDLSFTFRPGHHIAHQGRFVTKKAYEIYGEFDISLRYMMDYDLLLRLYKGGCIFKYINHDAALYRSGGATGDSIFKKKNDVKTVILNNGGSYFTYISVWSLQVIKYVIKIIFTKVFGPKLRLMIRHSKI